MRILSKLGSFLWPGRAEREMEREMESHLAMLAENFRQQGLTEEDAQREARRAFGGVEQAKELHRDERSFQWLEDFLRDLRHGARALLRAPGFTLAAVSTLALGIGVHATLFTAYNAVALKPLPVSDPDSLVRVKRWFESSNHGDVQYAFSYQELEHLRAHAKGFSGAAGASWLTPVRDGDAAKALGQLVTSNYFEELGVGAAMGRTLGSSDTGAVIVVSHGYWQRRLNGDGNVIGRVVRLNQTPYTVIGVAPESFTGTSLIPQTPDFWAPVEEQPRLSPGKDWLRSREEARLQILARRKAGVRIGEAQAETDGLLRALTATYVEADKSHSFTLHPTRYYAEADDPRFAALVIALMATVGLVLAAACANLANMLLARGGERSREIGARLALGASRNRIARQLLTENLIIALAGSTAGLVLASWSGRLLWVALQQALRKFSGGAELAPIDLRPDWNVVVYGLAAAVAATLAFGLWPAVASTRMDVMSAIRGDAGASHVTAAGSRIRSLFIGAEVGVAALLLVCAGFLTRGLARSEDADPGFDARHALMVNVQFEGLTGAKFLARQQEFVEQLRKLPRIEAASVGTYPMMGTWTPPIQVGTEMSRTLAGCASEGYFEALGISLVRGRGFRQSDSAGAAIQPVVISQAAAQRFWPGGDPLGQRLRLDLNFRKQFSEYEVVGVAADVRFANLSRRDPARVYIPCQPGMAGILVRTSANPPSSGVPAIRQSVAANDPELLAGLSVLSIEDGPLGMQRSMATAFGVFALVLAGLALALSAAGIYGVIAYLVGRRTREIGVRMALGASAIQVLRGVLITALRPALIGMAVGLVMGAALTAAAQSTLSMPGSIDFFYGLPFYDPGTFAAVAGFLLAVALAASAAPTRRALRVDPMNALRQD